MRRSPWLALLLPPKVAFDVERPAMALGCGLWVTAAQLLAGAVELLPLG